MVFNSAVKALKWGAFLSIAKYILQFVAIAIIARLLGAEVYGMFALGIIVIGFSSIFSNFGFNWHLIYKDNLTVEDIQYAFTYQFLAGLLVTVLLFLLSDYIAEFFLKPDLGEVIKFLSVATLLGSIASISTALLQRELKHKEVGIASVVSYFIGFFVLGLPMAWFGYGIISLITAWLVQTSVNTILLFYFSKFNIKFLFRYKQSSASLEQGFTVFKTNIVNWLLNNIDKLLVGRFLASKYIGFYNASYNLAVMPNSLLLSSLQPILLAAFSKVKDDIEVLKNTYCRLVSIVVVVITPVFIFLSLLSDQIIIVIYGESWSIAGDILQVMFLGMPFMVLLGISTPVLWNTNNKEQEVRLQFPILLIVFVIILFSLLYDVGDVNTVAYIFVMGIIARSFVLLFKVINVLGISLSFLIIDMARCAVLLVVLWAGNAIGDAFIDLSLNDTTNALLFMVYMSVVLMGVSVISVSYNFVLGKENKDMILHSLPFKFLGKGR